MAAMGLNSQYPPQHQYGDEHPCTEFISSLLRGKLNGMQSIIVVTIQSSNQFICTMYNYIFFCLFL